MSDRQEALEAVARDIQTLERKPQIGSLTRAVLLLAKTLIALFGEEDA
jgi:hypothetical protein